LSVAADFGTGDERIRIADGVADRRNTGIGSERSAIAAMQARAQCHQDILGYLAVVCRSAGHRDRLVAVEFVARIARLSPSKELLARHARRA